MTMNYMPGTASLIEEIDKKLLVVLRDGRTLIGYLRSIDQFANLVLHKTIERIHVGKQYGDIPRGIFVVRGENVVLLGEIDVDNENKLPLQQVSIDEILEAQRTEQLAKQEEEKAKVKAMRERGLQPQPSGMQEEF
ncbi:PREDICTED: U6 snRNA-associated Sm-like protein LSm1 [Branchiostoma belcheri]|uniref:U6 snRNA-associated Sm-like protein LSm1 n=1 Tax=Branchiostoma belcheri TaxID=7741 RepID=A0A6P4Z2P4_BRABE|nr:PREDICTED: U6 snRNA-associated Sm-like protein LSm1 [Branchiostoma belcheri]KAI8480478.1 SM-like, degradation of cytoplasmic mRNAs and positively regulates transcription initiation [Branchiostoma belcheri]KAI8480833.1 SM-like, degradation of cytoplasmic mRNAs and positively regulates transcription initiation [Branchiostoma belcheri]